MIITYKGKVRKVLRANVPCMLTRPVCLRANMPRTPACPPANAPRTLPPPHANVPGPLTCPTRQHTPRAHTPPCTLIRQRDLRVHMPTCPEPLASHGLRDHLPTYFVSSVSSFDAFFLKFTAIVIEIVHC